MMNTKRLSFGLLLIVVIIVCICSACRFSDSNQHNAEEIIETQPVLSTLSTIPQSDQEKDSNDSTDSAFKGNIQDNILSLVSRHNENETPIDEIKNAYINEDGHLFIVLSDHSVIDAGLVNDIGIQTFESEKQYTVNFYDYDGTLISSKKVNDGDMAIAPNNPVRDGYSFIGWNRSFTSVQSDLEVTAQYEPTSSAPQITVKDVAVFSGKSSVEVKISINNNPGILGMTLQLEYDSDTLRLTNIVNGEALGSLTLTKPGKYDSPCKFTWDGIELDDTDIQDGEILTLVFEISEKAIPGVYPLSLSYEEDGIINKELTPINVEIESGKIIIME